MVAFYGLSLLSTKIYIYFTRNQYELKTHDVSAKDGKRVGDSYSNRNVILGTMVKVLLLSATDISLPIFTEIQFITPATN